MKTDGAFKERQNSLLVMRIFLVIVFGTGGIVGLDLVGRMAGYPLIQPSVAPSTGTTTTTSTSTMSVSALYWIVPLLIIGIVLFILAIMSVKNGAAESSQFNQAVRERTRREQAQAAPVKSSFLPGHYVSPVPAEETRKRNAKQDHEIFLKEAKRKREMRRLQEEYERAVKAAYKIPDEPQRTDALKKARKEYIQKGGG